jgi:hypothetical protein
MLIFFFALHTDAYGGLVQAESTENKKYLSISLFIYTKAD